MYSGGCISIVNSVCYGKLNSKVNSWFCNLLVNDLINIQFKLGSGSEVDILTLKFTKLARIKSKMY